MGLQELVSSQLPFAQSGLHCFFDLALDGQSEALEELPELKIEHVLIHRYLPDWDPELCNQDIRRLRLRSVDDAVSSLTAIRQSPAFERVKYGRVQHESQQTLASGDTNSREW
jgi:hypothetical protein